MKILEKLKQKKPNSTFLILFCISAIIYIPFLIGHYATDTYNIAYVGYTKYLTNWYLNDGRLFSALILFISNILRLPVQAVNIISLLGAICINTITILTIYKQLNKYKEIKNKPAKIILLTIIYITIWNFTYVENMYFLESSIMALSILFYILSAIKLVERQKYSFVESMLLAIGGIISYQGTIGFLFVMVTLLTFIKNTNTKKKYKQNIIDIIKSGLIALIAVIVDLSIVDIMGDILNVTQTRLGNITEIYENLLTISQLAPIIIKQTCKLYPEYLFIVLISLTEAVLIIHTIIKKCSKTKQNKYSLSIILESIFLIIVAICSTFIPNLMTLSAFFAGRMRFCIGSLIGIIFIYIYMKTDIFETEIKATKIIMLILLITYTISLIINTEIMLYEHKLVNRLEKQECEQISSYIEEYEKQTNNKVDKIQIITIKSEIENTYYDPIKHENVLTYSAVRSNWSAVAVIQYYLHKNLTEVNYEIPQEDYNFIIGNSQSQICLNDTLYVKCYMY